MDKIIVQLWYYNTTVSRYWIKPTVVTICGFNSWVQLWYGITVTP